MSDYLLKAESISKSYFSDHRRLPVLNSVDLTIQKGESVVITGESGAGKSTLLQILGTLDTPTEGKIYFEDQNLATMDDYHLSQFRNLNLGFVFQFHYLLEEFTALENILLAWKISGQNLDLGRQKALGLLSEVGLLDRAEHYPSQMSGGEQQRIAICRALVMSPKLVLADEPTGNLDHNNTHQVADLMKSLVQNHNASLIVVTHDLQLAQTFPKHLHLRDGRWAPLIS